jgi:soluble lytic murein transglycosylase-like protein
MQIAEELASVGRRIAEIASGPALAPAFAELVHANLDRRDPGDHARQGRPARGEIERIVTQAAAGYGVDPALIDAVIENESGYDAFATSSAGARGLMQLMPETAASLGVNDSFDAWQNVKGGTRYLRSLLDRFGSVQLAVAAYNTGPNAVERYGHIPPYPQTREYVQRVLSSYRRRSQLGNPATNGRS